MIRHTLAALPLLCAMPLASCVQMGERDAATMDGDPLLAMLDDSQSCFTRREVRGFRIAPQTASGRDRVYLDTGSDERFVAEVQGACLELDSSLRMAIGGRTAGSVCTGDVVDLVFGSRTAGGDGFCPVRVIGRVPRDLDE